MLYLISYDITDDTHRHRVFEALKDFGRHVQYSVFECDLDEQALADLTGRIDFEIDPATDSCRFYPLCQNCSGRVGIIGRGDRYSEPDFVII